MRSVVYAMGRFNPPHDGHKLLIDTVLDEAQLRGCDYTIWVSDKVDKKNPLPQDKKLEILCQLNCGVKFYKFSKTMPTYFEQLRFLSHQYDELIFVTGSDHVSEYQNKLCKYNGTEFNFKIVKVLSCGLRNNQDRVSGLSGTKMREAAANNDIETFSNGVLSLSKYEALKYMQLVRKHMKLD